MGNRINLSKDEVLRQVGRQRDAAVRHGDYLQEKRLRVYRRYMREKYGNEVEGRSQYIDSTVFSTIEAALPFCLRSFIAARDKVEVVGPNPDIAAGLREHIRSQIDLSDGFTFRYDWMKEALMSDRGDAKISWWNKLGKQKITAPGPFFDEDLERFGQKGTVLSYATETDPQTGEPYYTNVVVDIDTVEEEGVRFAFMPPWEHIYDKRAKTNDDTFIHIHTTRVTLDYLHKVNAEQGQGEGEEPYFDLTGAGSWTPGKPGQTADIEESQRNESIYRTDPSEETGEGAGAWYWLEECYCRLDVDGRLVHAIVWIACGKDVIRVQENEDEIVPIASLVPIRIPGKYDGLGFGTLLYDLQDYKTAFIRATSDGVIRRLVPNFLYDTSAGNFTDIETLRKSPMGAFIPGKQGTVTEITLSPFDYQVLQLVDTFGRDEKENRTSVTAYNQGMDSDALNKTATGVVNIIQQSQQRLELINMLFAHTGYKQMYSVAIRLLQKNMTQPVTVMVDNKPVTLTPDNIQGPYKVKATEGIETDVNQKEAGKIERMIAFARSAQGNPLEAPIYGPRQFFNLHKMYQRAMGFRDEQDLAMDPMQGMRERAAFQMAATMASAMAMQGQAGPGSIPGNVSADSATQPTGEQVNAGA